MHYTLDLIRCFVYVSTVQGLRVRKACTRSADTVCEPHEGFHCITSNKGSCKLAVEHSKCKPGQYIKQTGECVCIYSIVEVLKQ